MLQTEKGQRTLRVLPPASPLRREAQSFLIDRQARGLSPRTIAYYDEKMRPLVTFLEREGVCEVRDVTPAPLLARARKAAVRRRVARPLPDRQGLPALVGSGDRAAGLAQPYPQGPRASCASGAARPAEY
jgi:hypothetical protein